LIIDKCGRSKSGPEGPITTYATTATIDKAAVDASHHFVGNSMKSGMLVPTTAARRATKWDSGQMKYA
jgi:hypothetical protein